MTIYWSHTISNPISNPIIKNCSIMMMMTTETMSESDYRLSGLSETFQLRHLHLSQQYHYRVTTVTTVLYLRQWPLCPIWPIHHGKGLWKMMVSEWSIAPTIDPSIEPSNQPFLQPTDIDIIDIEASALDNYGGDAMNPLVQQSNESENGASGVACPVDRSTPKNG